MRDTAHLHVIYIHCSACYSSKTRFLASQMLSWHVCSLILLLSSCFMKNYVERLRALGCQFTKCWSVADLFVPSLFQEARRWWKEPLNSATSLNFNCILHVHNMNNVHVLGTCTSVPRTWNFLMPYVLCLKFCMDPCIVAFTKFHVCCFFSFFSLFHFC